MYLFTWRS